MLAFVDESGNTGDRALVGSSDYFVVAVVVFRNSADAQACDIAISRLRRELNLRSDYEFHYAHNSPRIQEAFLRRVSQHHFSYQALTINKETRGLSDTKSDYGKELYRFAILKALQDTKPYLTDATVIIDESGGKRFRRELVTFLRQNLRSSETAQTIRKLRTQNSKGSNLLQMADYVAGVMNRVSQGKPREVRFLRDYLMPHETGSVEMIIGQNDD